MTSFMEFLSGSVAEGGFALALASLAVKGFVILLAATLASFMLQRASASLRHLCWTLAIAALLVFPIFSLALPSWSVPLLPSTTDSKEEAAVATPYSHGPAALPAGERLVVSIDGEKTVSISKAVPQASPEAESVAAPEPAEIALLSTADSTEGLSWHVLVFLAWLTGAAFVLLYMLAGTVGIWRIVARARPVTDSGWQDLVDEICDRLVITRPIQLLFSPLTRVPMTWGILRPVVLLPVGSQEWDEEKRRCVLAHELAHVKRLDCLTQSVARLAGVVHWFNPLVWKAIRCMHLEREKACDDYVLRAARTRATNYASHLIEIARQLPRTFSTPVGAVAMARRSQLEGRVLSILEHRGEQPLQRGSAVVAALLVVLLTLPVAAFRPVVKDARASMAPAHVEMDATYPLAAHEEPAHTDLPMSLDASVSHAEAEVQNMVAMNQLRQGAAVSPRLLPRVLPIDADDDAVTRSFNVSPGGTLEIRTTQGNIDVKTGSGNRVNVEVRRTARGRASVEDFDVRFEQHGNNVAVVGERSGGGWRGSDGINVNFIVTVPKDFNLDLDTKGGNISVSDLNGRARVSTSGGNLAFGEITGTVDAKTSGGNVSVRGSEGDVRVNTSGGNISLGRVAGSVDVKTSGGNINVDETSGELQAHTSGGQITVRLTKQPTGPSRLKTSGGGITIDLAKEIRVDVEAKTSAGRVTTDFDVLVHGEIRKDRLQGKINGGGPPLILDTSAGDIRIRRI